MKNNILNLLGVEYGGKEFKQFILGNDIETTEEDHNMDDVSFFLNTNKNISFDFATTPVLSRLK